MTDSAVCSFIARWQGSGGAEHANYAMFLNELADLLAVPRPEPQQASADPAPSGYALEYPVTFRHPDGSSSIGRIDLYKRGCFVLEAKQGTDAELQQQLEIFGASEAVLPRRKGHGVRGTQAYALAMQRARAQAERYAKALPVPHGWPPFLVVVDVGHSIELFADFSLTGKSYAQFPDAQNFRIGLDALKRPEIRELLARVWTEPLGLDPARRAAEVTREVAAHLADLSRLLEKAGHDPSAVARFLMRCLFTMFAEDIGLLPKDGFKRLLAKIVEEKRPDRFKPACEHLWQAMDQGGFEPWLGEKILRFNGGLFAESHAFALKIEEIGVLLRAARADWSQVEPAIFGTLLERALDKDERHQLGAHFTPRAFVERLILPTLVEPLRDDWRNVQSAALAQQLAGDTQAALDEVRRFHRSLCATRVLDPACGTGNFLYVAMEHMKRLEGEVLELARELGEDQYFLELEKHTVDPHQFLGIELNPRAAVIAELVLWIGWLQWHFRTRGNVQPAEPVLKNFRNIEARDALIDYRPGGPLRDAQGRPVTRWDGKTTKKHPVTGKDVPDPAARATIDTILDARPAAWPEAEFIVGNPPFQGGKDFREVFGAPYAEALWKTHQHLPPSADFVMYWWDRAALAVRSGKTRRFGLITTNSIVQVFNRKIVARHLDAKAPLSIRFAIPDHPWVSERGSAAVRVAMTVADAGTNEGELRTVMAEAEGQDGLADLTFRTGTGKIASDLTLGADVTKAAKLLANDFVCSPGVKLHGNGFLITTKDLSALKSDFDGRESTVCFPYVNGKDIAGRNRGLYVLDLHDLSEAEVAKNIPKIYQHILVSVKPHRITNNEEYRRNSWWLFGRKNSLYRNFISGIERYISTPETQKHRFFVFLDQGMRADNMLVNIGLRDAFHLGVLSSRIHVAWALAAGGRLGFGNDPRYNKTRCFDPFPFPQCDDAAKAVIRDLGERLDAHRKARQAEHPTLTLTGMYNVLEKLRAGTPLDAKDQRIHKDGLVSVLRQIHDELDEAVASAYGWPNGLADQQVLERLVALNAERRAEERAGLVRWLRPDYQPAKAGVVAKPVQASLDVGEAMAAARPILFPKRLPEQIGLVRATLRHQAGPVQARLLARQFKGAGAGRVTELLQTLVAMGHARALPGDRFAA